MRKMGIALIVNLVACGASQSIVTLDAGPIEDAYGCGDCFAAGLTYGLAVGRPVDEAVALGAQCGAAACHDAGDFQRRRIHQGHAHGAARVSCPGIEPR